MIDKQISHYHILEKLGEGGMGVVYKAHDIKLDRFVALKFLPQHITVSKEDRERFLQEARAASAVMHPNVCVIHDLVEHEDQQFIVMEYVDGQTLRQLVPIPKLPEAIGFAIQIAEALQEAHGKNVVHRDIKTDNIMVNSRNQIKVMDFGLAKLKGSLKLTKTSSTVGTLAYMAPEQIQGGEVDARSDIFSFGVVLFEMLSGRLPFRGEHEAAMIYSILNEEPEPVQKYRPEVSSELLHIIHRALEKDPEERYQSVHDLLIDLRRVKKETSRVSRIYVTPRTAEEGGVISTKPKASDSGRSKKPNKLWLWISLAVVLLLTIVSIIFLFLPHRIPQLNPNMTFRTLEVPFTEIYYPSISRDGQWVAFPARDVNNEWAVYFMNVATGNPLRLTKEPIEACWNAAISPDASEIVYDRPSPGGNMGLYVVPTAGGMGRKIAEPGAGGKWHPDGQQLGYFRLGRSGVPSQSGKREFWTVKRDGSENHLEFIDEQSYIWTNFCFDWSPDGKSIAYLRGFAGYSEIFIRDLQSGKERQLTKNRKGIDEIFWATNDQIFFTSNKSGNTNVWMIPARGGEAVQITKGTGPDIGVRASADGKRLLFLESRRISHIWTADIDGRNARQLTFDNQLLWMPSFSPDGKQIAFNAWSADILKPGSQVFIMNNDGSNRVQLTAGNDQYMYAAWSPNGKYISFASTRTSEPFDSSQIYVVETENPGTPRLIGKGIIVSWMNENELVVLAPWPYTHSTLYSIQQNEPVEVSEDTTNQFPLPDGKTIAVWDSRKGKEGWWLKNKIESENAAPRQILSSEYLFSSWLSVSLHYILYCEKDGTVWRISIPQEKREQLPEILYGQDPYLGNVQLSFDDKQLVFLKQRSDSRLVLIENLFK